MIKKEFRELAKPVLIRMVLIFVLPVFNLILAWAEGFSRKGLELILINLLISIMIIGFWVANYLGVTLVKSEYENHALEYFHTFPFAFFKSLMKKIFPRFLIILSLLVLYGLIYSALLLLGSDGINLIHPVNIMMWTTIILINGFLCGLITNRDHRAVYNLMTFLSIIFWSFGLRQLPASMLPAKHLDLAFYIVAAAVLSYSIFILYTAFKKSDLRSYGIYGKRALVMGLPVYLGLDLILLVNLI